MRRITVIYQRLAKVFLIRSHGTKGLARVSSRRRPAFAGTTPPWGANSPSIHRRHQLVPARARVKLAAALALDGGAALRRCCVLRERDGAAEAIGAALAGGEGGAGGGDADDEDSSGGDFDQQSHQWSHEASPPQ